MAAPPACQDLLFDLGGAPTDNRWGHAVAAAGDVNDDGTPDLVIGDNEQGNGKGRVRVLSGTDASILRVFRGDDANDQLGYSVAGVGDLNGDGFAEVLVGVPGDDPRGPGSGGVRVYSGSDGTLLYALDAGANDTGGSFGQSVAGIGDVSGDGIPDYVAGGPYYDLNGADSGLARIFSGADGSHLGRPKGDNAGDWFGYSVAGGEDVDGDGTPDLCIGAPEGGSGGYVKVISGIDGSLIHLLTGNQLGERFGWSVAALGDLNGDGHGEVLVGAPANDQSAAEAGAAYLFSGLDGSLLDTFFGDAADDNLGFSVCAAGDLNGDDVPDFLAGAPQATSNAGAGYARVWSGDTLLEFHTFTGDGALDLFGYSVASCGNLTGEDCEEAVIIGAPDAVAGEPGYARVHNFGGLVVDVLGPGSGPPQGGSNNAIVVTCATPDGEVLMAGGKRANGTTPAGACGLDWEIANAIEFSATADGSGLAYVVVNVPASATGHLIPVQAIDVTSCARSVLRFVQF